MKKLIIVMVAVSASCAFAVTPTSYSTEQTTLNAGGILSQSSSGDVVCKYFSYTTTALSNAYVALVKIPANARIIGGEVSVAAMGGAQTFDMGLIAVDGLGYINKPTTTADDVDLFLDGIAATNAVLDTFAKLQAGDSNANYAGFDTDVYLTIGQTGGADQVPWAADKAISGWVQFIKP